MSQSKSPLISTTSGSGRKFSTTASTTVKRSKFSSWIWEVLAVFVSLASFIATITILHKYDGKAHNSWRMAIPINTMIAILATVTRTTLAFAISACLGQQKWNWLHRRSDQLASFVRFDEASRGPMGASRLFLWLRFRHWAMLGALVIVGSVAFDPFVQAALSIRGQLDKVIDTNSTIGNAQELSFGSIYDASPSATRAPMPWLGRFTFTSFSTHPDFSVVSSIYNGFGKSSNQDMTVEYSCRSGNCTWEPFLSTAVCSSCNDISASFKAKNSTGDITGPPEIEFTAPYTEYFLPYGSISNYNGLLNRNTTEPLQETSLYQSGDTFMALNTTINFKQTVSFQDHDTMLLSFLVLKVADEYFTNRTVWEKSRPKATECALYLCTNAYTTAIQDGVLNETIIGSWNQKEKASWRLKSDYIGTDLNDAQAWFEKNGDYLFDIYNSREDLQLTVPNGAIGGSTSNMNRSFNVTQAAVTSTISTLLDLTGTSDIETPEQKVFPNFNDQTPLLRLFWQATNLTSTFDGVAKSMTNQFRNMSPHRQQGTTQEWILHFKVQWTFLIFPAVMVLLGIVYVMLAILQTLRLDIPTWKEGALPTLLHGFDGETQSSLIEENNDTRRRSVLKNRVRFDEKMERLQVTGPH